MFIKIPVYLCNLINGTDGFPEDKRDQIQYRSLFLSRRVFVNVLLCNNTICLPTHFCSIISHVIVFSSYFVPFDVHANVVIVLCCTVDINIDFSREKTTIVYF